MATATAPRSRHARVRPASRMRPEPAKWLWRGRIPQAAVTMLDGDGGLGKSQVGVDLAARVSAGMKMPDGSKIGTDNSTVAIYNFEDPIELQQARLSAAGADLSNIYLLPQVTGSRLELPDGLITLERELFALPDPPALIIIDPIGAMLKKSVLGREVVDGLTDIAKSLGSALIVVRHLNKGKGRSAALSGGGAAGAIGAARAAYLVAVDPDNPKARLLVSIKNNAAKAADTLKFHMQDKTVRLGTRRVSASHVVYDGTSPYSSFNIMEQTSRTSVQMEAIAFLKEEMSHGPRLAIDMIEAAERGPRLSKSNVQRARDALAVKSAKIGQREEHPAFWVWYLEEDADKLRDEEFTLALWKRWYRRNRGKKAMQEQWDAHAGIMLDS